MLALLYRPIPRIPKFLEYGFLRQHIAFLLQIRKVFEDFHNLFHKDIADKYRSNIITNHYISPRIC